VPIAGTAKAPVLKWQVVLPTLPPPQNLIAAHCWPIGQSLTFRQQSRKVQIVASRAPDPNVRTVALNTIALNTL